LTRLRVAAIIAFWIHFLAGAAMALVLSHGLETNPDFQNRLTFIVKHTALWTSSWLTWTAAAIAILYFYISFASEHYTGKLAVLLAAAAIAPDLSAQAIEIGVLPKIAARVVNASVGIDLFLGLHRVAVMLSGYVANGLYSFSALSLAWSTRRAYPFWVWTAGMAAGLFGFALSAAALADSATGMFWTNVVLVPSILLWLAGVAMHQVKRASSFSANYRDTLNLDQKTGNRQSGDGN
jgi:hypothetical protein